MATDPSKSLAPESLPLTETNTLAKMLESDLADLSVRELLSMLLSSVGLAERKAYLERIFPDKPNGFYDRSLQLDHSGGDPRAPYAQRRLPPSQLASALPARLQRRNSSPLVIASDFGSISACGQRRFAEDGAFQLPTGTGIGGHRLD